MATTYFNLSADQNGINPLLSLVVGLLCLQCLYTIVYRLYISPVAKVPGPKLAALSFWYEFYYDVVKGGQYTFKIEQLHQQYGPVIRINPYEVHIDDPEYYDQIYVGASVRPTDKWAWSAEMFATPTSVVSTVPHALHRRRRAMFSNYFSVSAVHKLESVVQKKVVKLMQRLDRAADTDESIAMNNAFSALTKDIITAYCFAKSKDCLDMPDFDKDFDDVVNRSTLASHFIKQFPWVIKALNHLPTWLIRRLFHDQALLLDLQQGFRNHVVKAVERKRQSASITTPKPVDPEVEHLEATVFETMLDAEVPASEKSIERLTQEAQLLLVAGSLTTAHTLTTITYHLLENPKLIQRLKEELGNARGTSDRGAHVPLKTLESLPFLNAVIREGLRMGYGVPHRLQRVSTTVALQYQDYTFPPGTPLSMSAKLMHDNENIFPEHECFNPDRWLPLDTVGAHLNKYLVAFSRGSRQCAGMNLAWAEMYLILSAVFGSEQRYLKLHNVVFERDVKTTIDGFNPLVNFDSEGMTVKVHKA